MTTPCYQHLHSVNDFKNLLDEVDHVILDVDGVIWLEGQLIGHAKDTINLFLRHNVGVALCSNNATSTRAAYRERLTHLGIDVPVEHIFTSGTASARYLKDVLLPTLPADRQGIYLIGQNAIEQELAELGLVWSGGLDPADMELMPLQDFRTITPDRSVGVVLVSFDMHYNYKKMSKAYNYLTHNTGCVLLLSNDDAQIPLHHGGTAAGEGAIAAPLRLAAKGPVVVAGKPNQPLLDTVLKRMKFQRQRTLMIGDRLETDITFGNDGNVKTLLVLSGSSKLEDIATSPAKPDFVCDSLGQIAEMLEAAHQEMQQSK